jgi:hypothetical protein
MNSPGKELPEEPNLRTSRSRPGAVSSWVWNIRAKPHVRLRIKGGSFAGVAHEIIGPAEIDVARSVLCESVYPTDYAEASLHLRGLPTRAKIKGLHRYWFDTGHHSWSNSEASLLLHHTNGHGRPRLCAAPAATLRRWFPWRRHSSLATVLCGSG